MGEVWVCDIGGHGYVFFPQRVEPPFHIGYAYSADGSSPAALLVDGDESGMHMKKVAPRWWEGEIHARWLAGQRSDLLAMHSAPGDPSRR